MTLPTNWPGLMRNLRVSFQLYVAACAVSFVCMLLPASDIVWITFEVVATLSIILVIASLVFAYRVQAALHTTGLSRTGAWVVIAAPMILSTSLRNFGSTNGEYILFWLLFAITPLAVLMNANRVARRVAAADQPDASESPTR